MPSDNENVLNQIELDLPRTFPLHIQFYKDKGSGQQALGRVLRAYSMYNTHIGYCQGMGFITAMFLMMMEEVSSLPSFSLSSLLLSLLFPFYLPPPCLFSHSLFFC
jgi:hypothetical protein